jgi:hypothetical protein
MFRWRNKYFSPLSNVSPVFVISHVNNERIMLNLKTAVNAKITPNKSITNLNEKLINFQQKYVMINHNFR